MADIEWQYWVFSADDDMSEDDLIRRLNDLGSAYYELVAVRSLPDGRVGYILKRPASPASN